MEDLKKTQMQIEKLKENFSKKMWKNKIYLVLMVLVLFFACTTYYYYSKFTELKKNPNAVAQEEVNELVNKVSKHMVLPEGEVPTIATVNNPENLRDQQFFSSAKKGDRVLIYTNAKKAILYDPVADRIVEVVPLTVGTPTPETADSALPEIQPETTQ